MDHDHSQHSIKNIRFVFFLNLGFSILEFIGGLFVNSVSIMSDALHDFGDSLSLGLSWYLQATSQKKADKKYSFGYVRLSLLGALMNGIILIAGSVYICTEAVNRLNSPEVSDAPGMILFAIIGVVVNGYAVWRIRSGKTMNERLISWHLLEDVVGWIAVLVLAIVLLFTDNPYLDPSLSLLIALYILYNVYKNLKETIEIFLQSVPRDINLQEVKDKILALDKIDSLHHTHLWSLEGEHHVFTSHLVLRDIHTFDQIISTKRKVKDLLKEYSFTHVTLETELDGESCELLDKNEN